MRTFRFHFVTRNLAAALLLCAIPALASEGDRVELGSKPAEILMTKINVSDLRRSFEFYTKVVRLKEVAIPGLPKASIDDANAPVIQVMLNPSGSAAEAMLCLVKQKGVKPTQSIATLTTLVFKTDNARAAVERARSANAVIKSEPAEFSGVVEGSVHDPDGYGVTFVQAPSVRIEDNDI